MVNIDLIKEKAKEMGITIQGLERRADVGNGTIGKWKASNPHIDTLQKVAKALNCTVEELIVKETA